MDKIDRTISPAPLCLTKLINGKPNYFIKGLAWKAMYAESGKSSLDFLWGTHSKKLNSFHIVKALKKISKEHCFYCDYRLMKGVNEPEIDHFCPKTIYPLKAYYYPNLFLCCRACNKFKSSHYRRNYLLKFDDPNYNFDDYYYFDFSTDKIKVRPDIPHLSQVKARYTLMVLGINKPERPISRRKELNNYLNSGASHLSDYSYRYYLKRIK